MDRYYHSRLLFFLRRTFRILLIFASQAFHRPNEYEQIIVHRRISPSTRMPPSVHPMNIRRAHSGVAICPATNIRYVLVSRHSSTRRIRIRIQMRYERRSIYLRVSIKSPNGWVRGTLPENSANHHVDTRTTRKRRQDRGRCGHHGLTLSTG